MLYSLYSLHQLRFVALCCIPNTACSNCCLLHYAVFPLPPAATAVYCIMLNSLYSLHQLRFVALCCIPFTACGNCGLLHYASIAQGHQCNSQRLIILSVSKITQQILLEWQCSVLLQCEIMWVCCDVSVELLPEINRNILKKEMSWNLLTYKDFKLKIYRVTLVVLLVVVLVVVVV